MGPPLEQSQEQIDIVGTAELDAGGIGGGELRKIKSFVDDRLLERQAQVLRLKKRLHPKCEYVVHPAAREPEADFPLWRFNCAGFVLNAYLEADIQLVDQEHAPRVTLGFLKAVYSKMEKRLDDPEFREEMGIGTGECWPVIMAGYVVNALNRSTVEIQQTPYRPQSGDEYFPTRHRGTKEERTAFPDPVQ